MRQPGVEVRPLRQMNGHASFNEVFLDQARVPAGHVIGEPGGGWTVALSILAHERRLAASRPGPVPPAGDRAGLAGGDRGADRGQRAAQVVPAASRPAGSGHRPGDRARPGRRPAGAPGDRPAGGAGLVGAVDGRACRRRAGGGPAARAGRLAGQAGQQRHRPAGGAGARADRRAARHAGRARTRRWTGRSPRSSCPCRASPSPAAPTRSSGRSSASGSSACPGSPTPAGICPSARCPVAYLDRDGVRIYYQAFGPPDGATPLLLTHGFSASSAMWQPNIAALAAARPVITWDLRGHGRSDAPEDLARYSAEACVADMAALLDACGIGARGGRRAVPRRVPVAGVLAWRTRTGSPGWCCVTPARATAATRRGSSGTTGPSRSPSAWSATRRAGWRSPPAACSPSATRA